MICYIFNIQISRNVKNIKQEYNKTEMLKYKTGIKNTVKR